MKKIIATACGLAAAALLSTSAMAGECSNASLKGHYTYWLQGQDASGKPYAEAGQEHFDGAGNIVTMAGVAGTAKPEGDKGTYTINADCTGTSTYGAGATFNIFVAPSGDSFVFSSSKEGVVQVGENTRVDAN